MGKVFRLDPNVIGHLGHLNTIIYVVVATGIGMAVNILAGYVISRNVKAKGILNIFVMFTAMFHGGLIPTYDVVKGLAMTDTIWSIVIPVCTNAFFPTIPKKEKESWAKFLNEALEILISGRFDDAYQKQLIDEFYASLSQGA